jgi:septal ring-binding cell division protein DamX
MRFEIRTGGILAILVGIGVLSGAVFLLGVWAGYGVGLEAQVSREQVATAYPLTPEAIGASPAAAPSAVGGASEESSAEAAASTQAEAAATPPAPVAAAMPKPHAHATPPERTAVADVPPPAEVGVPPKVSPATGAAAPAEAGARAPGERTASTGIAAPGEHMAATAPRYRRRPYNIQIEAAMDRNGADSMAQRLQRLGYTPHLVPTVIAGQTWYKVEVGPYATQDEAAAAQEQLRQKYNSAYGGGSEAAKPAGADGGNNDSGTVANPSD